MRMDVLPGTLKSSLPAVNVSAFTDLKTVAVIGLGYVGLPLAKRLVDVGHDVSGVDINADLVGTLESGKSPLNTFSDDDISSMSGAGFAPTTDFSVIEEADVVIFCVPTPLDKDGGPDLSAVISALKTTLPYVQENQLLSFESTTWPGTTRQVIEPLIAELGLTVGEDIHVVFSPEREDPGNEKFDLTNTPKLVGGLTEKCTEIGVEFYSSFVGRVVPVSSSEVAEMAKIVENTFRYINISLVNELKMSANCLGIDILEVLDACDTKPFGFMKFTPGPGIGGHCIPIDPHYLQWKSLEHGMDIQFISLAKEINDAMPSYVVETTKGRLAESGKAIMDAKVLVLGLSYKPNVEDLRESPSLPIIDLLKDAGADLSIHDPYSAEMLSKGTDFGQYVELTPETFAAHDAVLLLCDHACFDYDMIRRHAPILIDTRGRYSSALPNVVRA